MSDPQSLDGDGDASKLTKEQANAIAESLLAQARQGSNYFGSRRVPLAYRSPVSARLDPRTEWQLFRLAQRNLVHNWRTIMAIVGGYVSLLAMFLTFAPRPLDDWYTLIFFAGIIGVSMIIVLHVRSELARLAKAAKP
jgi:hypothetical protein